MKNIHDPVRWPDETQAQYRERQRESKRRAKISEPYSYAAGSSKPPRRSRDSGQHPKFAKPRKHKHHVHELRDSYGAITLTGARANGIGGPFRHERIDHPTLGPRSIGVGRRTWHAGEPVHVMRPVRAARLAAAAALRDETGRRA